MFISLFGILLVQIPCMLLGFTIYAKYYNCDPISNKVISKTFPKNSTNFLILFNEYYFHNPLIFRTFQKLIK